MQIKRTIWFIFVAGMIFILPLWVTDAANAQSDDTARSGVVFVYGTHDDVDQDTLEQYEAEIPAEWIAPSNLEAHYEIRLDPSTQVLLPSCRYSYSSFSDTTMTTLSRIRVDITVEITNLETGDKIAAMTFEGSEPHCPSQISVGQTPNQILGGVSAQVVSEWLGEELDNLAGVEYSSGEASLRVNSLSEIEFEEVTEADFRLGSIRDVVDVSFSPDGRQVILGSTSEQAQIWDVISGGVVDVDYCCVVAPVESVSYSPNGNHVLLANGGSVTVSGVARGFDSVVDLTGFSAPDDTRARYSPDGFWVLTFAPNTDVTIWGASSGREIRTIHSGTTLDALFNPSSDVIATSDTRGILRLWNQETGDEIKNLELNLRINSMDFSPDGEHLVLGSNDGQITILNVETLEIVLQFQGHESVINHVRYSPDGSMIVSASDDATVRVWNSESGAEMRRFTGHTGVVHVANFSPNGRLIVSSGADEVGAMVWSIPYIEGE